MPQVPTYDSMTGAAPPPAQVATTNANPALLGGYSAEQRAQFSQAVGNVGDEATKIAVDRQNTLNADMTMRSVANLQTDYTNFVNQAKQRRGADAVGLTQDTQQWWDENAAKYSGNLQNPVQQRAFQMQVAPLRNSSVQAMGAYEDQERKTSLVDSSKAGIIAAKNFAVAHGGNESIMELQRQEIQKRITIMGNTLGWDADQRQVALDHEQSNMYGDVIKSMGAHSPIAARAYFMNNVQYIKDGAVQQELDNYTKNADATAQGVQTAQDIVSTLAPNPNETSKDFDVYSMQQELYKRLRDNPAAYKAGEEELTHSERAWHQQQTQVKNAGINGVYDALDKGAKLSDIQKTAQWWALDGKTRVGIEQDLENQAYTKTVRAMSLPEMVDRYTGFKGLDKYLELDGDPDRLAGMSTADISALRPEIGKQFTAQLLTKRNQLQDAVARQDARMDIEDFHTALTNVGVDWTDPSKKALVGSLQSQFNDYLNGVAHQAGRTRPLSRTEKNQAINDFVNANVVNHKSLFSPSSWFGGGNPTPFAGLGSGQNWSVDVPVAGGKLQRVTSSDVPQDFIAKAQARNPTLLMKDIARMWANGGSAAYAADHASK